jgi:nucleotide-binding universal stress UspA family protein
MSTKIVVGVDESEHARHALDYAIEEARRRQDAVIEVIMTYPLLLTYPAIEYGVTAPPREAVEEATMAALKASLQGVPDDLDIRPRVAEGSAASVLVEASRDADLLVVGSRGRGGFRSLVLGSTSHQVVSHAHCPVVVVPAHIDDE